MRITTFFKTLVWVLLLNVYPLGHADNEQQVININTASVEQLAQIKGIGTKKAARIIAYREANGDFSTVAELANVRGIGVKTIDKNLAYLSVGEPAATD